MSATTTTRPEQVRDLGADLISDLAQHIGDPAEIEATFNRWLDRHGPTTLAHVALAALRDVFADHLSHVPAEAITPGAVTYDRS